jgi:hypothetical protein
VEVGWLVAAGGGGGGGDGDGDGGGDSTSNVFFRVSFASWCCDLAIYDVSNHDLLNSSTPSHCNVWFLLQYWTPPLPAAGLLGVLFGSVVDFADVGGKFWFSQHHVNGQIFGQ